jgi:2'-5' RNA ligase
MRLFVAAELPAELRRRLGEVQRDLKDLPLSVRWVRPEAMHLTFVFLGEVAASRREAIEQALAQPDGAAAVDAFRLTVRGLGTFPGGGRPRVIWAGLEGDRDAAERLKDRLQGVLAPLGFPAESRAFKPHLTLGRVVEVRGSAAGRGALDPFAGAELGSFEVASCILFESRLLPGGAQYTALRGFPLGAVAPAP